MRAYYLYLEIYNIYIYALCFNRRSSATITHVIEMYSCPVESHNPILCSFLHFSIAEKLWTRLLDRWDGRQETT